MTLEGGWEEITNCEAASGVTVMAVVVAAVKAVPETRAGDLKRVVGARLRENQAGEIGDTVRRPWRWWCR